MRINVYAEEMTDRVEIVTKEVDGQMFTGIRFYLYLPVTLDRATDFELGTAVRGPFIHHEGDDDSSAVTFWGKSALKSNLKKALALLEEN